MAREREFSRHECAAQSIGLPRCASASRIGTERNLVALREC